MAELIHPKLPSPRRGGADPSMAGKEEFSSVMEPDSKSVGSEAIGGCGMKRKAEETQEAATVDVVVVDRSTSQQVVLLPQDSSSEDEVYEDSDEDPEVSFAKIKARFEARVRECEARFPGLTYEDCIIEEDFHDDDGEDDKEELSDVVVSDAM